MPYYNNNMNRLYYRRVKTDYIPKFRALDYIGVSNDSVREDPEQLPRRVTVIVHTTSLVK